MTQSNASDEAAVPQRARVAVATMFFVNGAVLANWVPRIPTVQQKLGLSAGALGVALLGMAMGAVVAMPAAGWLVARRGSRPVTTVAALVFCAALPLPALAPNLPMLFLALVVMGACNGAMDVAMNAQGIAVERRYRRPVMASFHGLFSVGGLVGSAAGGVVAGLGVNPVPHLAGAALLLGGIAVVAARGLLPAGADAGGHGAGFARPTWPLLGLGVIAFCVLVGEGAMADWTAVYLHHTLATGPGLAAAGYAAFSLAMAAGRLSGDRLAQRLGPVALVAVGGALAAVGLGGALLLGTPLAAIVGFACVGAGFASIVPVVLSAAGRAPGMAPSTAIAAVTTTGYLGFLAGPPLIGFAADLVSLRGALGIVVVLSATVALLAPTIGRPTPQRARRPRDAA